WAFSFSLIGVYLSGQVDNYIAVFTRVALAFLLFVPLLRPRSLPFSKLAALTGIGGVQLGMTYLLLYHSFLYLSVAEVLLFTIFTPLYITLLEELLLNRRRLPRRWWMAAFLAVVGAAVIRYDGISESALLGFFLIQGANLCFALGQVAYRRLPLGDVKQQSQVFGFFFLGASLVSGIGVLLFAELLKWRGSSLERWIHIRLRCGENGLGHLDSNQAAKNVNTGKYTTINNKPIPAGILMNYLCWNREN